MERLGDARTNLFGAPVRTSFHAPERVEPALGTGGDDGVDLP